MYTQSRATCAWMRSELLLKRPSLKQSCSQALRTPDAEHPRAVKLKLVTRTSGGGPGRKGRCGGTNEAIASHLRALLEPARKHPSSSSIRGLLCAPGRAVPPNGGQGRRPLSAGAASATASSCCPWQPAWRPSWSPSPPPRVRLSPPRPPTPSGGSLPREPRAPPTGHPGRPASRAASRWSPRRGAARTLGRGTRAAAPPADPSSGP
mmetsp:Transcript_68533/g.178465  ORF Transcript_68533/g.178465 Transcript_68533/m.178465 type:complete len:207 (-) Transcript_68533:1247-1867(-)